MDWVMVIGMVLAAWAVVSVTGNERQRQIDRENARLAAEQAAAAAPPTLSPPAAAA